MPNVCSTKAKILSHPKLRVGWKEVKQKWGRGTKQPAKPGAKDGLDFPTQVLGSTPDGRCTVYFDPATGQGGQTCAQEVLNNAAAIIAWHDAIFGYKGGKHNVVVAAVNGVTDGTGGAYHYGCDFTSGADLYVDVAAGLAGVVPGLYAAELSECYMGANPSLGQKQPNPWGCGYSNGEGLSRVCANETCALVGASGALDNLGYGAASSWNTSDDWISQTEQTDQDYDSTGCAMVGIDWLRANGFALYQIAQAPCDNLEQTYQALTGKSGFYPILVNAVNALSGGVQSDYPFTSGPNPSGAIPGGSSPPPPPTPPASGSLLDTTATLTVNGVTQQVDITIVPVGTVEKTIDWLAVLMDTAKLAGALASGDAAAAAADAMQLLADLGIPVGESVQKGLLARLEQARARVAGGR